MVDTNINDIKIDKLYFVDTFDNIEEESIFNKYESFKPYDTDDKKYHKRRVHQEDGSVLIENKVIQIQSYSTNEKKLYVEVGS